jgi:Peptidase M15
VRSGADSVDLTALVLHPAGTVRDGVLSGYKIGRYQTMPLRGNPVYLPPKGFVEVTDGDRGVLVSPHFTLGQFVCKEPGEPQYMAFSSALLDKLEAIVDVVASKGWSPESVVIMSGFRTPEYNTAIGNHTIYSRHLWGDAADIYLDRDGNGVMDDLNGDGRSDVRDARLLALWIDQAVRTVPLIPGGLAAYTPTAAHGPFVHVDARGFRARW